jgi:hypothetical protein
VSNRSAGAGRQTWGSVGLGALVAATLAGGWACRERGRPDPTVRMVVSHERAIAPSAGASDGEASGAGVPAELAIPPDVAHAYTGVRILWKDKADGKEGTIEVPLGGGTPLPDPSLVVNADAFLPAFTMGGGSITSEGVEPTNPAARIAVFEKGQQIFGGWIFTKFPDVHPFTHKRFELRLEGGIRKDGK